MKSKMERLEHLTSVGVGERKLFHGTPEESTVRCICYQNFDHRMHGAHATMYGKGTYFSTTAKYSHQYTRPCQRNKGQRYMFFARVLVGKWTQGSQDLRRPPPVDPLKPHGALFDSCVNHTSNPTIFVTFERDQVYPEFLVEYKECEKAAIGVSYSSHSSVGRSSASVPMARLSQHQIPYSVVRPPMPPSRVRGLPASHAVPNSGHSTVGWSPASVSMATASQHATPTAFVHYPGSPSHTPGLSSHQGLGASYHTAAGRSSVAAPVTAVASQSQPSSSQRNTPGPTQESKKGCAVM